MTLPRRLRRAAECAGSAALAGLSEAERHAFLAAFDGHAAGRYSAINSLPSIVWTEAHEAGRKAVRALAAAPAPRPTPPAPKAKAKAKPPAPWSNEWMAERDAQLRAERRAAMAGYDEPRERTVGRDPPPEKKTTSKTYGSGAESITIDLSALDYGDAP